MTPIVLVPGLLGTSEMFAAQTVALWEHGPVTVANTLEGATMADIATSILATAPPKFALGGISMGGYLAFEILRRAPERVLALALLDTSARPDAPEQAAARRALVARARDGQLDVVASEAIDNMVHPARKGDPTLHAIQARMARAVGVEGFARQEEAILGRPDSRSDLGKISVRTLVLVGEDDPLTPKERAKEIADAVPNARLVVVPHCGHASTLEQPDAVSGALVEWIKS